MVAMDYLTLLILSGSSPAHLPFSRTSPLIMLWSISAAHRSCSGVCSPLPPPHSCLPRLSACCVSEHSGVVEMPGDGPVHREGIGGVGVAGQQPSGRATPLCKEQEDCQSHTQWPSDHHVHVSAPTIGSPTSSYNLIFPPDNKGSLATGALFSSYTMFPSILLAIYNSALVFTRQIVSYVLWLEG